MFTNIGGKIKFVAAFICYLGIFASVLIGISFMSSGDSLVETGIIIIIVGSLSFWLGSFLLFGYGTLIENSDMIVELLENNLKEADSKTKPQHKVTTMKTIDKETINIENRKG